MTVFERLTNFVHRVFKTNLEIFLEALKLSPNAQGYVSGSITELLLKRKLEEVGFEVMRIREKWEGKKHPNHHGDFYFRRPSDSYWFVMESKGVKSNSEKWNKLYNYEKLNKFLITHSDKINWIDLRKNVEDQITDWISQNLPKFRDEFIATLYEYEEVQKYSSRKQTEKSRAIAELKELSRDQINIRIKERLDYLMSRVRVLETHFVSGKSGSSDRTQATPRKDEFNIVSVDIFLKHLEHKFLFANPKSLESSGDDPSHLQQNYVMGFVFVNSQGDFNLSITEDWYENINEVYETLREEDSVNELQMQIDNRYLIAETYGDE